MRIRKPFSVLLISLLTLALSGQWTLSHAADRPYFEYKGDYQGEIEKEKEKFKEKYGYELMNLDRGWEGGEIKRMDQAFYPLPTSFYGLQGLKGFYRISHIQAPPQGVNVDEVPAPFTNDPITGTPKAKFFAHARTYSMVRMMGAKRFEVVAEKRLKHERQGEGKGWRK